CSPRPGRRATGHRVVHPGPLRGDLSSSIRPVPCRPISATGVSEDVVVSGRRYG
ncbi:MAG: hypothetical protein AVDCRST_MAG19-3512, partial [uncultured Thermomicrobiales bacterium]